MENFLDSLNKINPGFAFKINPFIFLGIGVFVIVIGFILGLFISRGLFVIAVIGFFIIIGLFIYR